MFRKNFASIGCAMAAALVLPAVSAAAPPPSCAAGKATAASTTWNFKSEASQLLAGIQQDADEVANHAAEVQSFVKDTNMDWEAHAYQLTDAKDAINDMGAKLCRLQTIRRAIDPWQRRALRTATPLARLMADNAQDAIQFVSDHQQTLWMPAYRKNVDNLFEQSTKLASSVKEYQEYAKVHSEDVHLQKSLGLKARS